MNQEFLLELLKTPSPSGQEMEIQKKWITYVKPFAEKVETDGVGNVIASINPDAPFKILLAGHCDEIAFVIKHIDDDGFIRVDKMGGIGAKPAIGMKVEILGTGKRLLGVFGVNAEHHGGAKEDFDIDDLYIDCGAKSKEEISQFVQVGDLAVYKRNPVKMIKHKE